MKYGVGHCFSNDSPIEKSGSLRKVIILKVVNRKNHTDRPRLYDWETQFRNFIPKITNSGTQAKTTGGRYAPDRTPGLRSCLEVYHTISL